MNNDVATYTAAKNIARQLTANDLSEAIRMARSALRSGLLSENDALRTRVAIEAYRDQQDGI